jgi:diguanylate cyclase (GGDEF)-like protein
MTNSHLPYAMAEVYCMIYAATVWYRLSSSIGSEHEVTQLRRMIYSYLGMLITDIMWALNEDGIITMPLFLNEIVNAICISCIVLGCYFWYRFIEDRLLLPSSRSRTLYRLSMVPMLAVVALDFISIFTDWIFFIDAGGHYQSTDLFWIHTLVNYYYLAVPTVAALLAAKRAKTKDERSECMTYTLYMVAPLIAGLFEESFPDVPLLALSIFMVIQIIFLMIQNNQIYNDALTGLNNRKRLNQYLEAAVAKADAEHPVALYMLDIDRFKSINDTYGHLEGDSALRSFASLIKEFSARNDAFAARYGGDEFCLVVNALKIKPEDLIKDFQGFVRQNQSAGQPSGKPYTIQASIGYCIANAAGQHSDEIIEKADEMLYENKKIAHDLLDA